MHPGKIECRAGEIELRPGRRRVEIVVTNPSDRPVQVGSHAHFYEINAELQFDREAAYGMCLDVAAGTAVRFEPGITRPVTLVAIGGERRVYGLRGLVEGPLAR